MDGESDRSHSDSRRKQMLPVRFNFYLAGKIIRGCLKSPQLTILPPLQYAVTGVIDPKITFLDTDAFSV